MTVCAVNPTEKGAADLSDHSGGGPRSVVGVVSKALSSEKAQHMKHAKHTTAAVEHEIAAPTEKHHQHHAKKHKTVVAQEKATAQQSSVLKRHASGATPHGSKNAVVRITNYPATDKTCASQGTTYLQAKALSGLHPNEEFCLEGAAMSAGLKCSKYCGKATDDVDQPLATGCTLTHYKVPHCVAVTAVDARP